MAKTVEYEGYTNHSTPQYQTDSEQWRLRIFISFEDHRVSEHANSHPRFCMRQSRKPISTGRPLANALLMGRWKASLSWILRTPERRATPRLRVQFRTTFSGSTMLEGTGVMVDLSTGGCRIESPFIMVPGFSVELRIHAPDLDWPLMIDAASVQWVSGQIFGLAFFQIRDTEHQRLEQVISDLMEG